ncbi:MAG TPA: hypothetical protein VGI50_07005 [Solirubrobacteraceae bacterium]
MALTEETLVDPRTGRIMNPHLSDYHVPVHADVPQIEIRCLGDPDPTMPAGMYGIGELGINGAPAAIANAVHHATGRRIHDYPITPDKVLGLDASDVHAGPLGPGDRVDRRRPTQASEDA